MNYDFDYFERGVETGKSNYQNYRWIPELTFPMAMAMIDLMNIKQNEPIIDYGCAKGYLVKALRILHREAWGADISDYALFQSDPEIKTYLMKSEAMTDFWKNGRGHFKHGICKDVLEHIEFQELRALLKTMDVEQLLTIVPLGKEGKYHAPVNDRDITHVICEGKSWWLSLFEHCGWVCDYESNQVKGIKDHFGDIPNAHLFMIHRRKG